MTIDPWPCSAFGQECASVKDDVTTDRCPFWEISPNIVSCDGNSCSCVSPDGPECVCSEDGILCTMACHMNKDGLLHCNSSLAIFKSAAMGSDQCSIYLRDKNCPRCCLITLFEDVEQAGEQCAIVQSREIIVADTWSFKLEPYNNDEEPLYSFLLGTMDSAAIFAASGTRIKRDSIFATISEVEDFFSTSSFNRNALRHHIDSWWSDGSENPGFDQQKCSFQALVFATDLYSSLQGATINIEIAERPLYEASWAQSVTQVYEYSRAPVICNPKSRLDTSFACLAMLETGEFNIDPKLLEGVLALSNGDSIYIRTDMISDPNDHTTNSPIRRVLGNLGRSQMAFMISPSNPRLGGYDIKSWRMINHLPFDGRFENRFIGTTLHLSFTDFELPVDVGSRGLRDTLAILLESVVSTNDRGNHIGDLDINAISSTESLIVCPECTHRSGGNTEANKETQGDERHKDLIAIDSWPEFFDLPETTGIFRANGNWQARLAAAAASVQQGYRAIILPRQPCLECLDAIDTKQYQIIIA